MKYSALYHVFPATFHVISRKINFLRDSVVLYLFFRASFLTNYEAIQLELDVRHIFGFAADILGLCATASHSWSSELLHAPIFDPSFQRNGDKNCKLMIHEVRCAGTLKIVFSKIHSSLLFYKFFPSNLHFSS